MDVRLLEHFLAVIDHGGVTRAAEAVFIAQPALSASLKALELELDTQLFERLPRGMEPTAAGRSLERSAREILQLAAIADATVDDVAHVRAGRLRVAAPSDLSVDPLAALVARFRAAHPGVDVHVIGVAPESSSANLLQSASSELAVDYADGDTGGDQLPLGRQDVRIGFPADWPDVPRSALTPRALSALPLIAPQAGNVLRRALEQWSGEGDTRPTITLEVAHLHLAGVMLAEGVGPAVIDAETASRLADRGVESRPLTPELSIPFGLRWHGDGFTPAASAFVEVAREHARQRSDSGSDQWGRCSIADPSSYTALEKSE